MIPDEGRLTVAARSSVSNGSAPLVKTATIGSYELVRAIMLA